ncbi:MAG: efflux transporter outer membrane subunit [Bacteroides sp.]|nr:efflux transporter outer membrane subunit [Bacteroides sp.]
MEKRIGTTFVLLAGVGLLMAQNAGRYMEQPLPDAWETISTEQSAPLQPPPAAWWTVFGDSMLDSLIHVASSGNFSLLAAIDRMEAARMNMRIERAALFPSVTLNAGWTRQQSSGHTSSLPQSISHYYDASLSASWEMDLFGCLRKRVKAGREQFLASREEEADVLLSLRAQVASAYISLRELQQELKVVEHNAETQAAVLNITEVRYKTGLASKLDVAQARSVYYSTQATLPQIEAQINDCITTLATLTGCYPQQLRPLLSPVAELPVYMEPIGTGFPAELLLHRPDIRQAERLVEAQAALLGASKSDWLPQVFLKGSVGYAAERLKDLPKHTSLTFEIAPAMTWTLFSGGKLLNATRQAQAQLDEAIHQFNESVLSAVQETDQAMNAYRNSIRQVVALREVCNQGEETLRLSIDLYKQGLSPFQNVLDALRSLLTYQNQLTQAQGSCSQNLITLYKALGGGE